MWKRIFYQWWFLVLLAILAIGFIMWLSTTQVIEYFSENDSSWEDQGSGQPVLEGEWVLEVEDGEYDGDELPQSDHQGYH